MESRTSRASVFLCLLVLSLSGCSRDRSSPAGPSTPDSPTPEHQAYTRINEYRGSRGLPALAWADVVATQARQHSQNMAAGATAFGHDGFEQRVAAIGQTIAWSNAGENVALDYSAAGAVEAWIGSPGHRANIEGQYDVTGVGVATGRNGSMYFTQIFIKTR